MGYPITTDTNLSIIQTARLLQALIDVTGGSPNDNGDSNNRPTLPESLRVCVAESLSIQKELVKEVDEYMHSWERKVDEINVVNAIVDTCPEFLATKDIYGFLPIHSFAYSKIEDAVIEYVPHLAEAGQKHGIGESDERGGLLIKNRGGFNALQLLTAQKKSSTVMEKLKCADPPLLLKKDVRKYHLLQEAVGDESIEMAKYMAKLDPSCLCYDHSGLGIPLKRVCCYKNYEVDKEHKEERLELMKYLLHAALSYDASDNSIGGLFAQVNDDELILDSMVEKYGDEDTWSSIKEALSSFADLPLLHQVIKHCPANINHVVTKFPNSVLLRDKQGRLPIHIALECGMEWNAELVFMMHLNRDNLKDFDPVTKRPPFVLAALNETASCDLSTVYFLLREHPEHVEFFRRKKRKVSNVEVSVDLAKRARGEAEG